MKLNALKLTCIKSEKTLKVGYSVNQQSQLCLDCYFYRIPTLSCIEKHAHGEATDVTEYHPQPPKNPSTSPNLPYKTDPESLPALRQVLTVGPLHAKWNTNKLFMTPVSSLANNHFPAVPYLFSLKPSLLSLIQKWQFSSKLRWNFSSTPKDGSDIHRFSNRKWVSGICFVGNLWISGASLSWLEIFQHSSALPNIKYNCVALFLG